MRAEANKEKLDEIDQNRSEHKVDFKAAEREISQFLKEQKY